ncbi:EAL domain-containing protein [Marinomonas sp. A79]|uniref:EAL domain-containing protein n=1 Tax=Marinomonas vulgaris TaxID=2823372 RepID=A0ABS5HCX2_9GAMM|nr:EAL domain-containing protein [Marinomonas vulgaris]
MKIDYGISLIGSIAFRSNDVNTSYLLQLADFHLRVVAEDVKRTEELDALKSFNVEIFQGYYFAKPLSSLKPITFKEY